MRNEGARPVRKGPEPSLRPAPRFPGATAALLAAIAATTFGCASMPSRPAAPPVGDYGPAKEYMTRYVETLMARHDVVGATVILVDGQEVAWARGFGYADREKGVLASPESVYMIASLTKLFTATAVMQLVEDGKVDLDAPVRTYIPEFEVRSRTPDRDEITVRMLLTHHSGLPSDWAKGLFGKAPLPYRSIVDYLKGKYASYPPNYIFNYSNIGVDLLGLVIERVSGMDYEEFVRERLFVPLGMTRSWFPPGPEDQPAVSKSYRKGKEAKSLQARDLPSTSMMASGLDLARFAAAMHARGRSRGDRSPGDRILEPGTVEAMWTPQNAGIPMDIDRRIGLMWQLGRPKLDYTGRVVFHHGLSLYHRSTLVMLPDHQLTAIVLTNSDTGDRLTERTADELLRVALQAKTGIPPQDPAPPREVTLTPEQRESYVGTFATLKGIARIFVKGDGLKLRISGFTFDMVPKEDGLFGLKYKLFGLIPITVRELEEGRTTGRTVAGNRVLLLERDGLATVVGEELDEQDKIPPSWKKRVGRYRLVDPDDDFELFDNFLTLQVGNGILTGTLTSDRFDIGTLTLILDPEGDDEALVRGLGRSGRETLYVRREEWGEVLEFSGSRFRKVE